jgi:hypothetical protein
VRGGGFRDVLFHGCPSFGNYGIDKISMMDFKSQDSEKHKTSYLAAEWYIHNRECFVLCGADDTQFEQDGKQLPVYTIETFLASYPKDSIEILDRTLLNLAQMNEFPGKPIEIRRGNIHTKLPLRSIGFCETWDDLVDLLLLLAYDGCIDLPLTNAVGDPHAILDRKGAVASRQFNARILPKGLQRIRELKTRAAGDQPQAFVAMWFDESRDKFFERIQQAGKDAGFVKCDRISDKETNNKICDEIIAEIRKSQCVIADFTGNRGGVYFEAGFALGLGIPVIWLVDAKNIDDLHFDTRQYNHIVYTDEDDLYEKLKNRIAATIPLASG